LQPRGIVSPDVQAILDAFADLVLLVGPDGSLIGANRAFRQKFADAGGNLLDLAEGKRDDIGTYLRRCAGTRQPLPGSLAFRTREGTSLACRCEGSAIRQADDGSPATILLRCRPRVESISRFTLLNQKIAMLTHEVLGRRRAEDALRRLNDELESRVEERAREIAKASTQLSEAERRFRVVIEGITDYAIFMLDTTGVVSSWNRGAERLKGYTADEIIGQHFSRFYTVEDRANRLPEHVLATAARTGRFEAEGWRVRKNGTLFWANVVLDAVRNHAGELVAFAKITRDLTERRTAEERLRQAQKMEVIGQLTGGIAHDFNNLLTVISGNVETLQRRIGSNDLHLHRLIDAALRGVERATVLTHRLLAFSRRQPLEPKPIDVNRLIVGMSDLLSRTLGEQVSIETVMAAGLWQISADPNQIENAVLNLAVNARDAMPSGGKLTIETANAHLDEAYAVANEEVNPGQYVMIAVSDTGLGMSSEIIGRIFEPFFTTKRIGEGTGLGLSQVHGFVKQSGGHIKVYSEPGEGTTVRLYFPRVETSGPETGEIAKSPTVQSARSGETVLVVEDDEGVRSHSTGVLRELGYAVLEAADGDAALSLLATEPGITLLFTDVGLPGAFNGRQLAEEALKRRPDLKILFTTGYARNAIVHQGRVDPGVRLIVKPFTYEALAAKIRGILDER
jgi:PAS domain S-box-containing protein